ACDEMIQVMLGQEFNEGIPAGLPPEVKVAHKTGWNDRLYHDAGIVFPPDRKPYLLVVMTRGIEEDADAQKLVADISCLFYSMVTVGDRGRDVVETRPFSCDYERSQPSPGSVSPAG